MASKNGDKSGQGMECLAVSGNPLQRIFLYFSLIVVFLKEEKAFTNHVIITRSIYLTQINYCSGYMFYLSVHGCMCGGSHGQGKGS